jgi:hypothetical protein
MTGAERLRKNAETMGAERERIVGAVRGLSQAQLDFQPAADSWSIGQIAQHVGLVERGLTEILKKMLRQPGGKGVLRIGYEELPLTIQGIPQEVARLGFQLLSPFAILTRFAPRSIVPSVIANPVVKAKAAPQTEPPRGTPRAGIVEFLTSVRQETMQVLKNAQDKDLTRYHWLHPLLGYQDLAGTLELIASHDRRHILQMDHVRNYPRFPS